MWCAKCGFYDSFRLSVRGAHQFRFQFLVYLFMYSLLLEWFKTHYNHQLFLFVRSRAAHISVVVCFFCIGVKTSAEFVCFSERERISIEVYNFGGGQCTFYLIARMARNIVVFKFKQNPCFFRSIFSYSWPNFWFGVV